MKFHTPTELQLGPRTARRAAADARRATSINSSWNPVTQNDTVGAVYAAVVGGETVSILAGVPLPPGSRGHV